jgi:MoaA/NifB/PqqE/SkfB family radical SAM enzyme
MDFDKSATISPRREMSALSGLRQFAAGLLSGSPRTLFLEVTLRCNASCEFCRYWQEPPGDELNDFRPIVKHFSPLAVTLTGGEPLLRADICDIVDGIKTSGNYFTSLITNGAELDFKKARDLRAAGLDGLSVSLNYPSALQDEEKGIPGLYRHLQDELPRLADLGFRRLSLNTVLMAENLEHVPALVERARAWRMGLTVSCYSPAKAGLQRPVVCEAQLDELREVVNLLRQEANGGCVENSTWYLDRIEEFHRRKYLPGCRAGRHTVHVTPDGMVRPCPDFPIVSHWSTYEARRAPLPRCGSCWYACRGEVQAPLTLQRIRGFARYAKPKSPAPREAVSAVRVSR